MNPIYRAPTVTKIGMELCHDDGMTMSPLPLAVASVAAVAAVSYMAATGV